MWPLAGNFASLKCFSQVVWGVAKLWESEAI